MRELTIHCIQIIIGIILKKAVSLRNQLLFLGLWMLNHYTHFLTGVQN